MVLSHDFVVKNPQKLSDDRPMAEEGLGGGGVQTRLKIARTTSPEGDFLKPSNQTYLFAETDSFEVFRSCSVSCDDELDEVDKTFGD